MDDLIALAERFAKMAGKKKVKEAPRAYDAAGAFAAIKAHHLKGDLLKIFLEVLPRETVEGLLELMPGNDAITKELERRDKPVKWADPSDFRF